MDRIVSDQLREGEEGIAIVRRSPLEHFWGWSIGIGCIIASFFFLFPLLRLGRWGTFLLVVLTLAGLVICIRTYVLLRLNILIITNQRLIDIDQKGMFQRIVSETPHETIEEMSFKISGILGTVFHIGTLIIHTGGSRADIAVEGIKHPQKVQELITTVKKKAQKTFSSTSLTAQELVQIISQLKATTDVSSLLPVSKKSQNIKSHDTN